MSKKKKKNPCFLPVGASLRLLGARVVLCTLSMLPNLRINEIMLLVSVQTILLTMRVKSKWETTFRCFSVSDPTSKRWCSSVMVSNVRPGWFVDLLTCVTDFNRSWAIWL